MQQDQSGFGIVEALVTVLVLAFIGLVAWQIIPTFGTQKKAQLTTKSAIIEFIDSQNLPKSRNSDVNVEKLEEGVALFDVKYGEEQDCPSGCFYSQATGISYEGRFGWLSISDYDDSLQAGDITYFDFDEDDTYLFSENFSAMLRSKSESLEGAYQQLLARDKDTALAVLIRIANKLTTYKSDSCLVRDLYQNINLKDDDTVYQNIEDLYEYNLKDKYVVKQLYQYGRCDKI